ncbi:MAG: secretin N-terminal domain-containing protein, partial [Planctomycetia bacterium]
AEEQEAEIAKLPAFLRQRVRNLLKAAPVPPVRSGASNGGRDVDLYRSVGYDEPAADQPSPPAAKPEPQPAAATPATVRVVIGDDNIAIASDDPEALELMDKLLATLLRGKSGPTGNGMAIYYLKSSDAQDMALLVDEALYGLSSADGSSSPRARLVPDARTNSLLVVGPPAEQKKVQDLLEVLDAEDAPSTNIGSQQRAVELRYGRASEIAKTLKEVFAADLYTPAAQGGDGGGGRRGQTGGNPRGKLSVGVDEESNLILISAPKALADAVEDMAIGLDEAAKDNGRTSRVVTLKNAKPEAMKAALDGLFGLRTGTKNGQNTPPDAANPPNNPGNPGNPNGGDGSFEARGRDERSRGDFGRNSDRGGSSRDRGSSDGGSRRSRGGNR